MRQPLLLAYQKAINVINSMTRESHKAVSRYINEFENMYVGPYGKSGIHMENWKYYWDLRKKYEDKLIEILYSQKNNKKKRKKND